MLNYPFSLKDKKILIVGGSKGTGAVITRQILAFDSEVIVIDENLNEELSNPPTEINGKIINIECKLSQPVQLENAIKNAVELAGLLNGVVFCYGIGGVRPLQMTKTKFVNEMFNSNVFLFIELLRLISRKGVLAEGSGIVALSSVSSIKGLKSKTAYCASKAALDAAVRASAAELATRSIRVNSIQKGWVSTDMQQEFIQNNMALSSDSDLKKQLLGVIEPEDIAYSVIYLLSDASKRITGTSVLLDGGYTL